MARVHLTNDSKRHSRMKSTMRNSGLEIDGEINKYWKVSKYQKRSINTNNFYKADGGWAGFVGTLIYDQEYGRDAIEKLYDDLSKFDVETVRRKAIGHFAVVAKLDETIYAFTDKMGAYPLYYTDEPVIISNSLHTLSSGLEESQIHPIRAIIQAVQRLPGEQTMFEGVKRLYGTQLITIEPNKDSLNISSCEIDVESIDFSSVEAAVNDYTKIIRDIFGKLENFENIALNTTGGIDTRTILAGLLDYNISPLTIYGVGNSGITNTKRSDLQAARKISEEFGLSFYQMDWSGSHPHSNTRVREDFEKYGFGFTTYGASDALLEELHGKISPYPTIQLGGYSPAFTNKKYWEYSKNETYSIEDLIGSVGKDIKSDLTSEASEEYHKEMVDQIQQALNNINLEYDEEGNSLEEFVEARLFLNIRNQSGNGNFFNRFSYYLAPFLLKELYQPLVDMPVDYRKYNEFQIRLIENLHPESFNVPVFSGTNPAEVDLGNYALESPSSLEDKVTTFGKAVLPKKLIPLARRTYKAYKSDPEDVSGLDNVIRSDNNRKIQESSNIGPLFLSDPDLSYLPRLNNLSRYAIIVDEYEVAELE